MTDQDQAQRPRRVFISYAWTLDDPDFKPAVIELADELRQNGIDAILDETHLRPGYDANAFMEQNATGADKVLCLCNREYAEKADARKGGAGTEAQVLSPQVFTQIKQERIIPVLFGTDDGNAYRPTFLSHLIYVDLRLPQRRYDNFEELMRVIFDQPRHVPRELGSVPSFVTEEVVITAPTTTKVRQLEHAAQLGKPAITLNLLTQDVVGVFKEEVAKISGGQVLLDQASIQREARSFMPILGDYAKFVNVVVGDLSVVERREALEDFLEFTVSGVYENEARYVIAHYLFLHYVAKLIRANAWETIRDLLARSYVMDRYGQRTTHPFTIFNAEVRHLEDYAARGPLADLLHEFARAAGLNDAELLEAVLFLMFRAIVHRSADNNEYWYPYELQCSPATIPTVLFVRAESRNFLEKLLVALDVESIDDLKGDEVKREIEGWQGTFRNSRARYIPPLYLFNFDKLGTRP